MNSDEIKNNILDFIKNETNYFKNTDDLKINEVSDGNINYIYRVSNDDQSMIIKFSDDHVRSNSTRKLSSLRNKIECEILKKQDELSGGLVPKIYGFSSEKKLIAMEDLSDYEVLRNAFKEKKIFPVFSKPMAKFLYDTLFKTTDLVLGSKEKKDNVALFVNYDMCEISERLVFQEPYLNLQGFNSFTKENSEFVEEKIYRNKNLHLEVAKLKHIFMTSSEAMIHGDLHAGSIFISEKGIKVFDPEFAFYGPIGYDIGNILASCLITYVIDEYENDGKESKFSNFIKQSIFEIVDGFIDLYQKNYDKDVVTTLFKNEDFKFYYLNKILEETAGYMGTEVLRRTIGVAKVLDIDRVKTQRNYHIVERKLLNMALDLILKRKEFINSKCYKELFNLERK